MRLLLVLLLIRISASAPRDFCNQRVAGANCTCITHIDKQIYYDLSCPLSETESVRMKYKPGKSLEVMCRNNNDENSQEVLEAISNFKYRLDLGEIRSYSVDNCVLNEKFDAALEAFKIESVIELEIKGNNSFADSRLRSGFFSGFAANLERLWISDSNLAEIDSDSFRGMFNLIDLVLNNNKLRVIDDQFRSLNKLIDLDLARNEISELRPDAFIGLTKLRSLHLWRNKLKELPAGIFDKLTDLKSLELSNNNLGVIDASAFVKLINLLEINLNFNNLQAIPDDLFKNNRKLASIRIGNNKFVTLPDEFFANFTSLTRIEVNYCSLRTLQDNLFRNSPKIATINLQYNNLTTLPPGIFNSLTKLEKLYLNNNGLQNLSGELFKDLAALKELHLNDNNLKKITSDDFNGMDNLVKFFGGSNGLISIENALKNKRQLEEVDLSHNKLTFTDFLFEYPFNGCDKLEILNLNHNSLSYVMQDQTWQQLKTYDLSNNNITGLDFLDLQWISESKVILDLRNNSITEINLTLLSSLAKSPNNIVNAVVYIDHNPLKCDCKVYHFLLYLNHSMDLEVYKRAEFKADKLLCAGPEKLAGIKVKGLHPEQVNCPVSSCPEDCDCVLRPYKDAFIMDCAARNLTDAPVFNVTRRYNRISASAPRDFCNQRVAGTNCTCITHIDKQIYYDLSCPLSETESVWMKYKPGKSLEVMCRNNNDKNSQEVLEAISNFKYRLDLGEIRSYSVDNCVLNEKFDAALEAFKIESVIELEIKGNNSFADSRLRSGFFSGFAANLERLWISDSNLAEIDSDSFRGMFNLIDLVLNNNKLRVIDNQFRSLNKLIDLDLARNEISELRLDAFIGLMKLRSLHLWRNKLKELPAGIFDKLIDLKSLELSNNNLGVIDASAFVKLINLLEINLNFNNLQAIPDDLFKNNRKLASIRIGNNKFVTLPDEFFANFTSLTRIEVNYCSLRTLQDNLFRNSPKIATINLQYNNLTTLPPGIFNSLTKLEKLYLNNNGLQNLSGELFKDLAALKELHLNDNNLKKITSDDFNGMDNLVKFFGGSNGLISIENALKNKRQLEEVDLSHNKLTFTDFEYPFNGCDKLEILNLNHNSLSYVMQDQTWQQLKTYDLSNNNITGLESVDLQWISESKVILDLRNNSITEINLTLLASLAKSPNNIVNAVVYIDHNPLKCDCKAYDFLLYLNHSMDLEVYKRAELKADKLLCAGPEKLAGIKVKGLHPEQVNCPVSSCPEDCDCVQRPYKDAFIMDCAARNLTDAPVFNVTTRYNRIEVYLQDNLIKEAPRSKMGYENVTKLNLSNNIIQKFNWVPPKVELLNLDNNNISSLNYETLLKLKSTTTLHGNPWICDCNARNLSYYVKGNVIPMKENIRCKSSNLTLSTLSEKDLCPTQEALILLTVFAVALIITIPSVIAALYYKYNREIKIWLYAHNLFLSFVTEEDIDKDKLYDAFISFSHVDDEFVLNDLVPNLETGPNAFKLCIHLRNFIPGEFIATQVTDSVKNSRRTIIVLSQSFLDSVWGQMEFRTAHSQAMSDGCCRVIVILLGEVDIEHADEELKLYLKTNTYIKWGDPWFWDKLRYALPHRRKMQKANRKFENIVINLDKMDLINANATANNTSTPPAHPLLLKNNPLQFKHSDVCATPPAESGAEIPT